MAMVNPMSNKPQGIYLDREEDFGRRKKKKGNGGKWKQEKENEIISPSLASAQNGAARLSRTLILGNH